MKPRLYLVDAHAFLHRAYHALPPLTNSKGEPVGALYGFARMLLQLLKKEKPEALAVCFDTPEKTFRHEAHKDYKATRKETDADLVGQLARAREMVEAMGLRCVELPGYEADDVMATLARRCRKDGYDAVLVTGDKDALQMVGPGIRVLNVAKNVWMDAPQIEEKLGVPPSAVVDYLALVGDASDNVPGVRGIGPVGAVKLLKRFPSLSAVLKAAKASDPAIPPKTAKALVDGEKDALSAIDLIRLRDDAPIDCKVLDCGLPKPEEDCLREVFGRLEFGSLLEEMLGPSSRLEAPRAVGTLSVPRAASSGGAAVAEPVSVYKTEEASLEDIRKELRRAQAVTLTALPSEGADLLDRSPAHLSVGLPDGRTAYLDETALGRQKTFIAELLAGRALKVGYNLKETRRALKSLGLPLEGSVFDTMLAAYCLDPNNTGAGPQGKDWKERLGQRHSRSLGHEELRARLRETGVLKLFEEIEMPLSAVLCDMEEAGIAVDEPYLRGLSIEFERDIAALKKKIDEMAGSPINVNSPKQLGELLFDKLNLPVTHKTAKGGRSTGEEALSALAALSPIPAKVLEYRELTKLKNTYIDGLISSLAQGRVHTHFDQTGTTTGRLSSTDPNLQNIPVRSTSGQKIRKVFTARKGWTLLSADYSQIDLRVLAHVSQDKVLLESFVKKDDIHTRTACEMFHVAAESVDKEMRRRAKAINFGIVYGQTAHGLSQELGIPFKEANEYIKAYLARYPGVQAWIQKNLEEARTNGFVRTFTGRIRWLPELAAKNNALRQFGERAARNTPIQGGSADIIKLAMLRIHEGLASGRRGKAVMLLQIHDELLFEAPKPEALELGSWVRETMESAVALKVPLVVDVKAGENWRDMEKIK
jgi:DNA polymerase-1